MLVEWLNELEAKILRGKKSLFGIWTIDFATNTMTGSKTVRHAYMVFVYLF